MNTAAHCPDDNHLVEYVDGLLAAAAQRALDRHIDGCRRCRRLLAQFAASSERSPTEPRPRG